MIIPSHNDPMGNALLDYLNGDHEKYIIVKSDISEDDVIPVDYLFRNFNGMPPLERKALQVCNGRILDVGAGSGSHSLYLQNKGIDVTALDISDSACECCKKRGVANVVNADFFDLPADKNFDAILMLMNGIGFVGTVNNLDRFFQKTRQLLAPAGQVLLDSSDISYMFEDEDEEIRKEIFSANQPYYGEVTYIMEYKNIIGKPFKWLFVDPELLNKKAGQNGFKFELIKKGANHDYLARLTFMY